MRVEIDFDKKVIKIAEKANFKAVMDFIQTLPNWQEFSIDTHTEIVYRSTPYYVHPYIWYDPYNPYRITYCGSTVGTCSTGDSYSLTNDCTSTANISAFTYTGTHQFDISEN